MKRIGGGVTYDEIPVCRIQFNSLNLRGLLRSPRQIERMANSFLDLFPFHDPIVSLYVDKGYLICAGESRILAHHLLTSRGHLEYGFAWCKVIEAPTEEFAMKILAEENAFHKTIVPAATANEVYWHYRVDFEATGSARTALEKVMGIWVNNSHVFNALVVPGWLITHSHTAKRLLEYIGSAREHIADGRVQEISSKLRQVRLVWWYEMIQPFRPLDSSSPKELLATPPQKVLDEFDGLIQIAFDVIQRGVRGDKAIVAIRESMLPIWKRRLEAREAECRTNGNIIYLPRIRNELKRVQQKMRKGGRR